MSSDAIPMPALRPRWKQLLIDSSIARILIFIVVFSALTAAMLAILKPGLGWLGLHRDEPLRILADVLIRVVPSLAAYWCVVHFIERRRMPELALRRLLPDNAIGFAGGALLIGSVMALLWSVGAYEVTGTNASVQWVRPFLIFGVGTAIVEEIIFRGILFRLVEEGWGLWPALIVSALFFGGVHIGNQNASLGTSFAIAVEAGVLLGVVYHVTRSLWTCIGVHMSWNFICGTIFGSPVSGNPPPSSWLQPHFDGPAWLTGGSFGIEGSVLTVLLSLVFSAALLHADRWKRAHNVVTGQGQQRC